MENYPKSVSVESTKIILEQMQKYICKIILKDGSIYTGFFCNIYYQNINLPVMMTNNHILNENYIKENKCLKMTLNDDKEEKIINLDDKRIIYNNSEYDITIIEINPQKDNIYNFMDIDENIFKQDSNVIYGRQSIYMLHYENENKSSVSYGIIRNIDNYGIYHYCSSISKSSSGSPILNLLNNKIIGINKEISQDFNKGIFLKDPINDFIEKRINNNNLEITLKIEKNEKNRYIYFLDNTDYIDNKNNIKHFHENLKELNESNVEIYINNIKYKYKKFFKPFKDGIYQIKLKFKNNMKDCSFMFAGCKNIINFNLSSFKTKDVINMRYMFSGCENVKNLDLSNFDTQNVNNMEGMFGQLNNLSSYDLSSLDFTNSPDDFGTTYIEGCKNLSNLNLSSFNTKNVKNMMNMFLGCENLKNINLSSFDTRNVINMSGIFGGCKNLTNIDLSSFNTKNVNYMIFMFSGCINLLNLNLSSFDTKNVISMLGMFYGCKNLTNLDLSSFDTQNVSNVDGMFAGCDNILHFNLSSFDQFDYDKMICNIF